MNLIFVFSIIALIVVLNMFDRLQFSQTKNVNQEYGYTFQDFKTKFFQSNTFEKNIEKEIHKKTITNYKKSETKKLTIYDVYSKEEIYLMQRIVETETHGADLESKTNVASVILNRINHPNHRFGSTASKVMKSPNQFAYFRKNITETTVEAIENAFIKDTTNGALFFHSGKKTKTFNRAKYIFTDKVGHHFYK